VIISLGRIYAEELRGDHCVEIAMEELQKTATLIDVAGLRM
jgi:hypothetical protein